jgi:hypothetical protein
MDWSILIGKAKKSLNPTSDFDLGTNRYYGMFLPRLT